MMEDLLTGGVSLVILLILVILVIEWIFLPFAIFGTKDKLNQIIAGTNKTNKLLNKTNKLLEEILGEMIGPDR